VDKTNRVFKKLKLPIPNSFIQLNACIYGDIINKVNTPAIIKNAYFLNFLVIYISPLKLMNKEINATDKESNTDFDRRFILLIFRISLQDTPSAATNSIILKKGIIIIITITVVKTLNNNLFINLPNQSILYFL